MIRLEKSLDNCLRRLEERYRDLHPDVDWATHDEIESIASASGSFHASSQTANHRVRFGGHVVQERKAEKLRTKVINLEQENQKLKQQLQQLEKRLVSNDGSKETIQLKDGESEEKKSLDVENLTEGDIWSLVRSS
jgi:predicted RNase H-like nuclease (RuvC/YqgF family)